jgi:CIC family chloride channel protein
VVQLDEGVLVGVVSARAVRAVQHGMAMDTPLRELADPRVVLVVASIQVFDLIAVMRGEHCRNAVMTRDGKLTDAASVVGVVTWEDLVESANLSDYLDRGDPPVTP